MLKHILNYAPGKILPGIISFISIMIFARIFTPTELGNYNYLMSILTLGSATLFTWIRLSSFRYYNIYIDKYNKSLYYSYVYSLTLILVLTVLSLLFFPILFGYNNETYNLLFIGAIAILSNVLFEQILSFKRSELNSKGFAIFSIVRPIIQLIVILFLTKILLFDEASIFWGWMFSGLTLMLIYYINLKKTKEIKLFLILPMEKPEIIKDFYYYGYPLTFSFLFSLILSTSDRIFIKHYLDAEAVAIYSIGYDLTSFIITNLFMIINFSFIPIILKKIDSNQLKDAQINIRDYFLIIIIFIVPITMFLFIFAEEIAKYVLGGYYANDDTIMTIKMIALATLISGIKAYFFDFAFKFGNKTKLQIYPVILAAIINLLLNFLLIPKFELTGAVIATVIAYVIALLYSIHLGKKAFNLSWYSNSFLIILIQLSIIFVVYYIFKLDNTSLSNSVFNLCLYSILVCIFLIFNLSKLKRILK